MKRILVFGVLPLILGIAAAALRACELAFVFDPATGLPSNPMAVTPALYALTCAAAVFFLVAAITCKSSDCSSPCRCRALPCAAGASFAILLAFAGFELYVCSLGFSTATLIYGALTGMCAVSILAVGLKRLEMRESSLYNVFAAMPAFWASYTLILIFRQRISDPIISDYIYLLLALICILLFAYCQCAYVFGRDRRRLAAVVAPMGVFFCLIELVAPIIAGALSPGADFVQVSLREAAPLAAMLVYMPFALQAILRNSNCAGGKSQPE